MVRLRGNWQLLDADGSNKKVSSVLKRISETRPDISDARVQDQRLQKGVGRPSPPQKWFESV